ncbi:pre-mRNA cleavage complex 2 protein Pcf11 [Ambystoma mexicanum]|uniref:pre-mRNA cleavage complex 2 protein Pcf11 n=1 Tax=Ambystoma mexicanum TaxID=8296 RepID=UPI0037E78A83
MEAEDACREYQSSLEDLTFNSKPHINMLTILAEENLPFARDIVALIEAQIAKAPTAEKLPVMYLMDSIVKNVGREYLDAFSKNLVSTFVNVFEKVEENTRKSLFKLRSTWDEIFPSKKLYALDVRVNSLDPAWPIKPLPPNVNTSSIHVNPKFLNKTQEEPPAPIIPVAAPVITPIAPEIQKSLTQEQIIRQQLLAKQKQLLELQQKKLELELEQTKAQLAVSLGAQQGVGSVSSVATPTKQHPASQAAAHANVKPPQLVPKAPHVSKVPHIATKASNAAAKAPQTVNAHPEKERTLLTSSPHEETVTAKDPCLSRVSPHSSHAKDQGHKKEVQMVTCQVDNKASRAIAAEKPNSSKQEKTKSEKLPRRETAAHETKSKSLSPLKKSAHLKDKLPEGDGSKSTGVSKRDPRLRKHQQGSKDDDKERRKSADKKEEHNKSSEHRTAGGRTKVNGIVQKHDPNVDDLEKPSGKMLRSSTRKRTRSRSPKSRSPKSRSPKSRSPISRSPIAHSPKRRDRRSPKRRPRSISPPQNKTAKPRHSGQKSFHIDEFSSNNRDERHSGKRSIKQDLRDSRRLKKPLEERTETVHQHSTRSTSEPKENVENWPGPKPIKTWKSGWEESKSLQSDDLQGLAKPAHTRRRDSWQSDKGLSPRTPKQHRLSVDANLQIPKELSSVSKGELLKKANDRLTSGEITQEEFLVVAHKIRQLFQYQEEKHRFSVWGSPTEEKSGLKKESLLSNAESTYYKHKAQLKRTQVHHFSRSDIPSSDLINRADDDALGRDSDKSKHGGRFVVGPVDRKEQFGEKLRRHSPASSSRAYRDLSPIESRRRLNEQGDVSKGTKSCKSYDKVPFETWSEPADEFRKSPRHLVRNVQEFLTPERELDGIQDYDCEERLKFGLTDAREEPKLSFEKLPPKRQRFEKSEKAAFVGSPGSIFGSKDVGETLDELPDVLHHIAGSPLHPAAREGLANTDFDLLSDGSSDSDDPLAQISVRFDGDLLEPEAKKRDLSRKSLLTQRFDKTLLHPIGPQRLDLLSGQSQRFDGATSTLLGLPSKTPGPHRFEGTTQAILPQRFEGLPSQGLTSHSLGNQMYDGAPGHHVGPQRFDGPPGQPVGPQRFDGPPGQPVGMQRFDGPPGQPVGPQRFDGPPGQPVGPQRFDGPLGQPVGPQRFDGPPGQPVGPQRFDGPPGQPVGPQRFDGPPGQPVGPQRFDGPPGQPVGPQRFDGPPGQPVGPQRFDGPPGQPLGPQRFDGPPGQPVGPQRFDGPPGQPVGPHRFDGPPGQPVGPHRFDGPPGQSVGPQRFEGPSGQSVGPPRYDGPPVHQMGQPRFGGAPGQSTMGPPRFQGAPGQPVGPPRFEGVPGPSVGPPRFEGSTGQPVAPRFEVPGQPGGPQRFERPPCLSVGPPRFEGAPAQVVGPPRFEGPPGQPPRFDGLPGQPIAGMRFEGPPGAMRFERPPGQPMGVPRLDGPGGPRFEMHQPLRFDGTHVAPPRFDGPPGHTGPRFDAPPLQPRFDGLHGQPSQRFERPLGQQTPPRFDGPMIQQSQPRFDTPVPQQPPNRFGLQGPRFESNSAPRLNAPLYGQPGPYSEPPSVFSGPFQRFDLQQPPNFSGPPPTSVTQTFPNLLNRPPPPHFFEKSLQSLPFGVPTSVPMGNLPPQPVSVLSGMPQPVHFDPGQQFPPTQAPNPGQFESQSGAPPFSYPENHLGQLDVNELFSKLLSTGILKTSQTESASSQLEETAKQPKPEELEEEEDEEDEDDQSEDQSIPDLTNFALEDLKQRYDSVINRLYTGIQCYSCGMRFTAKQTDVYADHLDWHYRQNRTEKDVSRKVTHRRWYYGLTDWIEFEEIADLEERAKSLFFERVHEEVILKTQEAVREKEFQSVPAGRSAVVESCDICQEQFEQYWDEEEEEWHLKNAIRVDEQIYHPSCYEDYKNTSSFLDSTPSPSKTLMENPLNVMLNIVKQELKEPISSPKVSSPKIKEEPEETPTACPEENKPLLTEIKNEPVESPSV